MPGESFGGGIGAAGTPAGFYSPASGRSGYYSAISVTSGSYTVAGSTVAATVWQTLDTNLDRTVTCTSTTQVLEYGVSFYWGASTVVNSFADAVTIVSGTTTSSFTNNANQGIAGWRADAAVNVVWDASGSVFFQPSAGDISNSQVKVRLMATCSSTAGTRLLTATTAAPLSIWLLNHG